MPDGFGQPDGFTSGGYIDPLTGEFQPGVPPSGTGPAWSRGIRLRMGASGASGGSMIQSRAKFPAQAASAGGSEDMNPHA